MPRVIDIPKDRFDAVLFDLDGVLTDTASLHASAWKAMFDQFLRRYGNAHDVPFEPFEIDTDYRSYVDGKPRYEGVSAFLESRRIVLPEGTADDPPEADTVGGLGNRKNEQVQRRILEGVAPYESSVEVVRALLDEGIRCAVVSSSRNATSVLNAAGIGDLFECVVDGQVADDENIAGKPEPDMFLTAAERIGAVPEKTVVIEDAIVGVEAAASGSFGLIIAVNRARPGSKETESNAAALTAAGAHLVITDLAELLTE